MPSSIPESEDDDTVDEAAQKATWDAKRAKMAKGLCPTCNVPGLTRKVDPRQAGDKGGREGLWVNYRHAACGFAMDVVEDVIGDLWRHFEAAPEGALVQPYFPHFKTQRA